MGNGSYQLTSAGWSAHGWQIGWHWVAGNSHFQRGRIFIFCFSEPFGINIEGYEGLVHCTRLFIQIRFGVVCWNTSDWQTLKNYSIMIPTMGRSAGTG